MYVRYLSRGEEEDDRGSDDERRWSRSSMTQQREGGEAM
tara:strand:- start:423 stop:539 length:117 start_codon:yes stop_codon:yes gene_type:complete